jgi:TfoX/Sxy family transcriptional regulator of competence genes
MAYDEDLAARIRELLAADPDLTEKKMFGGLAFLIRGRLVLAVSSQGGLMIRVDPAESDKLIKSGSADVVEMRGHAMQGWVRVTSERLKNPRLLDRWVTRGTAHARSLPLKTQEPRRRP